MKLAIRNIKQRNPLVAATKFRRSGRHRLSRGGQRLQARRDLRFELQSYRPPNP